MKNFSFHFTKSGGGTSCQPPLALPERDWLRALLGCLFALLLFVCVDGFLYWQATQPPASQTSAVPQPVGISSAALAGLLARYQTLAAEHAALASTTPVIADPSAVK